MKNLEKFEKEVNLLLNDKENEQQIEKVANLFNQTVYELSSNEVSPDSEEGKRFLKGQKLLSGIGRKLVNLLTIEFKITFAGVTLCYLRIPKLETNDNNNKVINS